MFDAMGPMRKPGLKTAFLAAALVASVTSFLGCTANVPKVLALDSRLIVYAGDSSGGRSERLTVFASIKDSDGKEDISEMYIIHDDSELYWHLNGENWISKDESGGFWVGGNGLAGPAPDLPRGIYRVLVVDRAGERVERTFSLNAPDTSAYELPSVTAQGTESMVFTSKYATNTVFFFDAGSNVVKTVSATPGSRRLDELWGNSDWKNQAYFIALYSFDIPSETGFFSWKTRLPN